MKKLFLLALGVVFASSVTFAGNYTLNNDQVDNLFASATETVMVAGTNVFDGALTANNAVSLSSGDATTKVLIAWVIDWVGLGAFGVHRYVLGTKGSMWAIYTFTVCGIFGLLGYYFRRRRVKSAIVESLLTISFREGTLLSVLLVGFLIMKVYQVFYWWTAAIFLIITVAIEMAFLYQERE